MCSIPTRSPIYSTPYRRTPPTHGYTPVQNRVVAPVPDKTEGLQGRFVRSMYERAAELIAESGKLVAIGYSFHLNDRRSYDPLLLALDHAPDPRIILVNPDATTIAARLKPQFQRAEIQPIELTFGEWVRSGFSGCS